MLPPRRRRDTGDADADTVERLRAAIDTAAARPGALTPRPEFVAGLHQRLRTEIDQDTDGHLPQESAETVPERLPRRRVLQVAAGAVGAVALGAAAEHRIEQARQPGRDGGPLTPKAGRWTPVAATADVPAGSALSFTVANVAGVLANDAGRLGAVSGACTHQGCLLRLDEARQRLDCPCHSTAFSLSGAVLNHALPVAPPPLPQLAVRERTGQIEVLLPPA